MAAQLPAKTSVLLWVAARRPATLAFVSARWHLHDDPKGREHIPPLSEFASGNARRVERARVFGH
jgi:hypothetical protein